MTELKYQAQPVTASDLAQWDEFVETSHGGTVFHQTQWLRPFGDPVTLVGCYDPSGALVGGLPLVHQSMAGLQIARPPYLTPYLGPVTRDTGAKYHKTLTLEKDVALSLIDYIKTSFHFARVPLSPDRLDTQPFQQHGFDIEVEHTYVIDLEDMEHVWKELDQDKRRKIKQGYKEQLAAEPSDDLDQFFPLLGQSLAAHGKPLPSKRLRGIQAWYEALRAEDRTRLLFLKDAEGQTCAGAILVWDRTRAYYLLSGMNRDLASGNAGPLLLWECMRFCHEEVGVREFDFDGSEVPSVEVFFRGFGGRLTPRFSVMWGRPLIWPIRRVWHSVAGMVRAARGAGETSNA